MRCRRWSSRGQGFAALLHCRRRACQSSRSEKLMKISVVTASHNSRSDVFNRVSEALSKQTLPKPEWQWIVIDNASTRPLSACKDLVLPDNTSIIRHEVAENEASLVDARC